MKPGYKSTEFYLTVFASIAAIAVAAGFLTPDQGLAVSDSTAQIIEAVAKLAGVLGPVVGVGIYTHGRSKVKAQEK